MELVSAHFSIKFPRQANIRRKTNDIEDILEDSYETPQVFSMPDDFAADAPRLLFASKGGHSRIVISQISIEFEVTFDGDFVYDFDKTKEYILGKTELLLDILKSINIKEYCYCGLAYNINMNIGEDKPLTYIGDKLSDLGKGFNGELCDASWSKSYADGEYFMNERVGINRKLDDINDNVSPDLIEFRRNKILDERIGVLIDINDRRRYVENGKMADVALAKKTIGQIFRMMENGIEKWRKSE